MHSREDEPKRCNGTSPIPAVGDHLPHHYTDRMGRTIVVPPGFYEFLDYMLQDALREDTAIGASRVGDVARFGRDAATVGRRGLQIAEPILERRKKKRRVSKYQREFGKQLKKLKRAHPRTPVTKLMKRAHSATKRSMRRK